MASQSFAVAAAEGGTGDWDLRLLGTEIYLRMHQEDFAAGCFVD